MLGFSKRIALLVAVVGVLLSQTALAAPAAPSTTLSALEAGVLGQINGFRAQHGLSQLQLSPGLEAAARDHSLSMATQGYFSHDSADGTQFWQRLKRFYPTGRHTWAVGENLLWSEPDIDPASALQLWLGSPPHRAILLDPRWRQIGLSAVHVPSAPGTFGGQEVTVLTADFGVRR
jgi:uncharacterized protein YkwD